MHHGHLYDPGKDVIDEGVEGFVPVGLQGLRFTVYGSRFRVWGLVSRVHFVDEDVEGSVRVRVCVYGRWLSLSGDGE
jgi:hypothetical protein